MDRDDWYRLKDSKGWKDCPMILLMLEQFFISFCLCLNYWLGFFVCVGTIRLMLCFFAT